MSFMMVIMLFVSMANFAMSLYMFMDKMGTDGIRSWWAFFSMNLALLLKRPISVKPHLEYYSPYQATENFFLLKVYKCSHERHFKLISGNYTTIVPEKGIIEIDGKPLKQKP